MPVRTCRVSFLDHGKQQTVEVAAETVYEAAVLGLHAFSKVRGLRGPRRSDTLRIDVVETRTLTLRVGDVWAWLYERPAHTAEQRDRRKRLRNIIEDGRR